MMKEKQAWFKPLLDNVVREMIKTGAIRGAAVEAAPIWGSPGNLLIAKVWDASNKSQFIWTIAGDNAVTDHIPGSLAANAQAAARHFALKWQMDADRLLQVAKNKAPAKDSDGNMEAYTSKLIGYAEALYDLAGRDDIWKSR